MGHIPSNFGEHRGMYLVHSPTFQPCFRLRWETSPQQFSSVQYEQDKAFPRRKWSWWQSYVNRTCNLCTHFIDFIVLVQVPEVGVAAIP